jgi:SulP family sulfate permease
MREVPLIDSSGVGALAEFVRRCRSHGVTVIVTGVQPQPRRILRQMGFGTGHEGLCFALNLEEAVRLASSQQV